MANTYHQIFIQLIFAVKGRQSLLKTEFRQDLFKIMSSMISELGHKSIIVNGMSDHVHCLIGFNPDQKISELVRDLKTKTSHFMKDKNWSTGNFSWQSGYGAFSYSRSQLEGVYRYILKQEEHHRKKSFKEEYLEFLEKFEIDYKSEYLFEFFSKE